MDAQENMRGPGRSEPLADPREAGDRKGAGGLVWQLSFARSLAMAALTGAVLGSGDVVPWNDRAGRRRDPPGKMLAHWSDESAIIFRRRTEYD